MGKRGPGKFDSDVDEVLYSLTLDGGADEEVGNSEDFGWYGLMSDITLDELERAAKDVDIDLDPEEAEEVTSAAGVIISENSQGFVGVKIYRDRDRLEKVWQGIQAESEEFYADSEEDMLAEEEEVEEEGATE